MQAKKLFEPLKIRNTTIKNRICVPPMVIHHAAGQEDVQRQKHYQSIAAGGAGLVIVEATCVADGGQLHPKQIGIWADKHIDTLRPLAKLVQDEGAVALLQIHHAGVMGSNARLCPSEYALKENITGQKMAIQQVEAIVQAFVSAAGRAQAAGFFGVELHACHSYLISQFLNSAVNKRGDIYGQKPEKFAVDILNGIRAKLPQNFIVGIRLGAFEPGLEDGLRNAKIMEEAGFDFLDISYGFFKEQKLSQPPGFPFKDIVYAAAEVKKQSKIPVFAVNGIRTPGQAQDILNQTNVDMVDIGRGTLVDYNWANKAKNGQEPALCLACKKCVWFSGLHSCPGRLAASKAGIA